ncbi:hypothetical protein FGLOB1_224 [Fusarium globosum]|uniref:PNPLA domain-containing protein n=1 Tax=Fusarium globosum TaxID=78864 RepID=A0A8H6DL47_9HYPO|nr:hypothetical protein FGLOB1_224 [Fusarium globosum]
MASPYDILEKNAWATDENSEITQLVVPNDNSEAVWRNGEELSGQPASEGEEPQADTNDPDDQRSKLLKKVLDPDLSNLDSLHRDDDDSLWFSVDGDTGSLELREFPRFGAIISEHQRQHSPEAPPFPRLVSFIGKTGEGKSAIIRLLIEHLWDETAQRRMGTLNLPIKAPVVGPRQTSIPTSGDVHLYYDTLMDDNEAMGRPLLYADCEGFGAGTQRPTSHQGRRSDNWTSVLGLQEIPRWQNGWRYITSRFRRPLPGVEKRQDAVQYLFPKLLYNFSDVVVNVMQSHSMRQIDDSIVELLEWAEVSQTSGTNRFGLPHLIIVLNRSDDESDWDPMATGQQIFEEQKNILEENHKAKAIADRFRRVGIPINTLEDLLLTSYASVHFIRLPQGKSAFCLSSQLGRLHTMIYQLSNQSLDEKVRRRMLLSAPNMDEFFRLAFDHYSNKVKEPFDFLAQLISLRPPLPKMAARLSELMIETFRALDTNGDRSSIASRFCGVVAPLVCSVMALDAARSFENLPGRWIDIFCGENDQTAQSLSNKKSYRLQVIVAFDLFTSLSLKCEFQDASGGQCVNKHATHRCHQNSQGRVIGHGSYESQLFDELVVQWDNSLHSRLEALDQENDSQDTPQSKRNATWRFHRSAVQSLHSAVGTLEVSDLMLPTNIGRRILSLDGGGSHSAIQTSILKDIENRLGGEIPIRHFFDLIGGSGTGGLLALGIGIGNWDVDESATHLFNIRSKLYLYRGLEDAIKEAFGEDFARQRIIGSRGLHCKLKGSLPTAEIDLKGQFPELKPISYVYEAGHRDGQNFTIRDAAKATSQVPVSDGHLCSRGALYLDGGICCNNPAEITMAEAQIMWPLDENTVSHLLLSIGNGWAQDADDVEDASNKHSSWIEMKKEQLIEYFTEESTKVQRQLDRNRLSEKPWNEALSLIGERQATRCVRLNPKISENKNPEDIAASYVSQEQSGPDISKLCHTLLATTFYFDATEQHRQIGKDRCLIKGE